MTAPSFRRPERSHVSTRNVEDARGTVRVMVILQDRHRRGGWRPTKGNIVRSLSVADARVSDVFARITDTLFSA